MGIRESIIQKLQSNISFKYLNINEATQFDYSLHRDEVLHELKHHIGKNQCSELMVDQLTQLHGRGYVEIRNKKHPYEISPIYWILESIIKKEIEYKVFGREESLFFGKKVLHVHHSQSFYIEDNHIRYFKNKYKNDKLIIARIKELLIERPGCNPEYEILYETLMESMTWKKKTGEWILFQIVDNSYYFIGLGLHDASDKADKKLFSEINKFIRY